MAMNSYNMMNPMDQMSHMNQMDQVSHIPTIPMTQTSHVSQLGQMNRMHSSGYNDPVTRAVVDNIMGVLPTTKRSLVMCEDCDLCFTSQTVLDAHLQGARHAKQIRSKVIMSTLKETKVAFTQDQEANGLKCNLCNVCLNSIQQLQTHLNGSRHQRKAGKGGPDGTDTTGASTSAEALISTVPIPGPRIVIDESLACQVCNKYFNSKSQYDVHITSRKHAQKILGASEKGKKKRYNPFSKKRRADMFVNSQGISTIPSLSNNFISGGYTNAY